MNLSEPAKSQLIAIVDDEPDIVKLVSLHLEKESFKAVSFLDASSFLKFLQTESPDLIILDLMLPDENGLNLCKKLKSSHYAPIPLIILSAKDEEIDKILGFEFGADDYVTKPFSPRELIARVKAVLRRPALPQYEKESLIVFGPLSINTARYEVTVNKTSIPLTTTEFKMLKLLAANNGIVFSRNQILDHVWKDEKIVTERTIDVHIKNLREKLLSAGDYIKSIRGIGYKFSE